MKRRFFLLLLLCLTALLVAQQPLRDVPVKERIVVLISIDGMPGWAFADPAAPLPTLRRLAREGVLARGMRVVNPSVTWPNHTSMVTGVAPAVHGVLANGMILRQGPRSPLRVEPWRDKAEMVRATTVYDLAHRAGLSTAQVNWVAIQNPGTITYEFPERPKPGGRMEQELVSLGVLTDGEVEGFNKTTNPPWRDHMWTAAGVHMIRNYKPNLLLFHLLNLDSTHHRYGPRTLASQVGQAFADARVKDILDAIEAAGLRERATLFIVSDHGFRTVTKNIRPNALLRREGLLTVAGGQIECDAWVVPEGGSALVYVTDRQNRARLVPKLKEILRGLEGIARVFEPSEYGPLGLPLPGDYDQAPDLYLAAKEGYAFNGSPEGEPIQDAPATALGTHGYVNTDPEMLAMFLAWGYGIDRSAKLDVVDNLDLAPTMAALLGVKLDGARRKPLPILAVGR